LGGGGATGIAWEVGALDGLAIDVALADRVIGTSAGAAVAAKMTAGFDRGEVSEWASTPQVPHANVDAVVLARLAGAQVWPDRMAAIRALGRRGLAAWSRDAQDEWVSYVADDLRGRPWPDRLVLTATNAITARGTVFDAASGVDLADAVAASCSVPGVFPPVVIDGVPYMDGGMPSPANLDLAWGFQAVVAVTSHAASIRPYRWPGRQARELGVPVCLVEADTRTKVAQGPDMLDTSRVGRAYAEGLRQGRSRAEEARAAWRVPA